MPARRRGHRQKRSPAGQGEAAHPASEPRANTKTWPRALFGILAVILIGAAMVFGLQHIRGDTGTDASGPGVAAATFVGSASCAGCHAPEDKLWRGSQHQRAMAPATDATVLGDFNNASLDHFGVKSRFFRKGDQFLVETDGADGKLATFEVKYAFGVDPLQQYLIEFPDGRLQALSIAWDSRPKEKGGQRWFHLYPDDPIRHDDVLHWTKLNQNWNSMCAECHSTGVHKNYDAARDRFATTSAEISVGCEACHGAGSQHVGWARSQGSWWPWRRDRDPDKGLAVRFDERAGTSWAATPFGVPDRNLTPALLRKEVETCGLCHARRALFAENRTPGTWLSDTHHVALMEARLFAANGQMRDREEVYNYASFKQSKMFAKGVTCSDCHDPHSAGLRAPVNQVCAQCHPADRYETPAHHHHAAASPPLTCASCHMPERTYMVVDKRHDHSFRIPRPDLSVLYGTPNACTDCHGDKPASWASAMVEQWFGPKREGFQDYAGTFHAAWTDRPEAEKLLADYVADQDRPAYVRASALAALGGHVTAATVEAARQGLADPDPMVRIGAMDMLAGISAEQLWPVVAPLLSDPVRGVRLSAVSLLAGAPTQDRPAADRDAFDRAAAEFIAAQRLNADRPEARTTLGAFYAQRGRPAEAEDEFKAALALSPQFTPAAANLADLYRQAGRDQDGRQVLDAALALSPGDAGLHHALGLLLIRGNQRDLALEELRKASDLAPEQPRYAYVYAVALNSAGRRADALTTLKDSLARHANDRETLSALIGFAQEGGDIAAALLYAEKLQQLQPDDPGVKQLIASLRARLKQ